MAESFPFPKFVHYFNASAVAVSVRWRRPFESSEQLGAVLVPAVGGKYSSKCKTKETLAKGAVTVDSYESVVSSDYADLKAAREFTVSKGLAPNSFSEINLPIKTSMSCMVKGLQITNSDGRTPGRVVRLERLGVSAESSRKPDGELNSSELEIDYGVLRIDGKALKIDYDTTAFNRNPTHSKLAAARLHPRACLLNDKDRLVATVVNRISWVGKQVPDVKIDGHTVFVPGFGTIYFGEVISSCSHRRVLTARFALGSPAGGGADGPEIGSNGHGIP